jgi:hypothetical protein
MENPTEAELLSQAFRILGRKRSVRKTEAARQNAKKGGRPRGMRVSEETKAKISASKRIKQAPLDAPSETLPVPD